jgi:hypothetical protein
MLEELFRVNRITPAALAILARDGIELDDFMRYVRGEVESYSPDLFVECERQSVVQWSPRMPGDCDRPEPPTGREKLEVCVRNSPGDVGTTITTVAEELARLEAAVWAEGGWRLSV